MSQVLTYRANQIGGCVTLITTEVNGVEHSIIIDYGSSLDGSDKDDDFQELWKNHSVDAVFFTHYHGDHVGRILEIPDNIPIYMGSTAKEVMINIQEALVNIPNKMEAKLHERELALLKNNKIVKTFKWNGKTYDSITDIPGFVIEPYSVDHSAYDAFMFLIEADDKDKPNGKRVILHTGDFRGHGRRGHRTLDVINTYVHKNPPWHKGKKNNREVDTLIIEGTMMSRMNEEVMSEFEMQVEATKYLKAHKYAFLICSSTNLDSLASFYQAAQSAAIPYGRYLYTYNYYFAKQLKTFSDTAGRFSDVYQFKNVHELDLYKDLKSEKWINSKTQKELMEYTGFIAVIKPEDWCNKFINPFIEDYEKGIIDEKPVIIYSMWEGYILDKLKTPDGKIVDNKAKKQEWIDFIKQQESKGVEIKHLHTSGHATADMIKDMIIAVNPKDEIIPIHTEYRDAFSDLDIGDDLKAKIV